jgi:hypothetical protein
MKTLKIKTRLDKFPSTLHTAKRHQDGTVQNPMQHLIASICTKAQPETIENVSSNRCAGQQYYSGLCEEQENM